MEHHGYILIADITGYTVYLNESELDHARGTLSSLLELLIDHTKPPLVVSGLEGDAVFSYGLEDDFLEPQTLLETIESTYVSFRQAIELMVLNNSCQCSACANVSSLDLKFFLHYGPFALQEVRGSVELMGRDVNLVHRLLKNSIAEETGIHAYMLCTAAAVERLSLDATSENLISHIEHVTDFGKVKVWVKDMHPVYDQSKAAKRIDFAPADVIWRRDVEIDLPTEVVWDYVNHSEYRNLISSSDRFEVTDRKSGRIGEGSVYQCYHGDRAVPQVVLEWRPFEQIVVKQANPVPGPVSYIHIAFQLKSINGGTTLSITGARPTGRFWQRAIARLIYRTMDSPLMKALHEPFSFERSLEKFRDAVEDDASNRGGSDNGAGKPSADFLRDAVQTSLHGD